MVQKIELLFVLKNKMGQQCRRSVACLQVLNPAVQLKNKYITKPKPNGFLAKPNVLSNAFRGGSSGWAAELLESFCRDRQFGFSAGFFYGEVYVYGWLGSNH